MNSILDILIIALILILALIISARRSTITGMGELEMYIQQPWYNEIVEGRKTVEGRVGDANSKYHPHIGQVITIKSDNLEQNVRLTNIIHYPDLDSYLQSEGWQAVAPHTGSMEGAKEAYAAIKFKDGQQVFSKDRIANKKGINALHLELL